MVADRKLLLLAICCLSQWTFEQIVATYTFSEAECVATWCSSTGWASSSCGR